MHTFFFDVSFYIKCFLISIIVLDFNHLPMFNTPVVFVRKSVIKVNSLGLIRVLIKDNKLQNFEIR